MTDTPKPTPEGLLIKRKREAMQPVPSVREMAKRAGGISEGRWRQIENGYESKGGMKLPAVGKAETIAAMFYALGGVSVGEYKALRECRPDVVEVIDARDGGPRGLDGLRRPNQPTAVNRLRQIRDELDRTIRQLENEDHDDQAPQQKQEQGRPSSGGGGGEDRSRRTPIARTSALLTDWDTAIQGIRNNPRISEDDKRTTITTIEQIRLDAEASESDTMFRPEAGAGT